MRAGNRSCRKPLLFRTITVDETEIFSVVQNKRRLAKTSRLFLFGSFRLGAFIGYYRGVTACSVITAATP